MRPAGCTGGFSSSSPGTKRRVVLSKQAICALRHTVEAKLLEPGELNAVEKKFAETIAQAAARSKAGGAGVGQNLSSFYTEAA